MLAMAYGNAESDFADASPYEASIDDEITAGDELTAGGETKYDKYDEKECKN